MITDSQRREATLYMGEKWHELRQHAHVPTGIADDKYPGGLQTKALCSCGEYFWDSGDCYSHAQSANRPFTIDQDKADLARKISEKGEWDWFRLSIRDLQPDDKHIEEWLLTMPPAEFFALVAGWKGWGVR